MERETKQHSVTSKVHDICEKMSSTVLMTRYDYRKAVNKIMGLITYEEYYESHIKRQYL